LAPPDIALANSIRVELRAPKTIIPVGSEVILEFAVINKTEEPVKLAVPGALVGRERPDLGMGLPLEHVFSGENFRGLEVAAEENPQMGDRIVRKPELPIPAVTLAPFAVLGLRFDVARFYPGLHQAGVYQLGWQPYGGVVSAEPLTIRIIQYKQVAVETEYGVMTLQLLYDKAPRHVANFLELVEKRFYNNKTFHSVYANQFILGGCPDGNGSGKRPDGTTLPPEFSDTPFDLGTVGMALIEGDPHSGSSQFFICLSRQKAWDGHYTAFAQVTGPQSLEVLKKLGDVAVDSEHRPKKPLIIRSMTATDAIFLPKSFK
jgi:cyclophilin family peptidyl-prolyl cis-trans isomerase